MYKNDLLFLLEFFYYSIGDSSKKDGKKEKSSGKDGKKKKK